ncbi:MAG TPA: YCF48-related protein [Pyrinomonadaceae bacterium]|nr:YCF48-related protein [Pyrinomonadaceae bacterium]
MKQIIFSLFLAGAAVLFGAQLISVSQARVGTPEEARDVSYAQDWRVTGPSGGDVRALVVDPNDPSRFYFGTLDGQIYTSTDGARTWRLLINLHRPQLFVDHIIVDPRNSKVLYVATHRHKDPGGFFKSTDGGLTWRESSELKNEALHSLEQSERDPNILITGTFNGIYKSIDSGETWTALPTRNTPGLEHVESLAIDPRNTNVIYAGTWYLPYKSVDGGQTWRIIKNGIIDDSDIFAINLDPRNPDHVIASACSGIYETRDAGENWHKVQGIPSQSRRTRAILQHPTISGLVFAGTTEGFWRSAKGGENNSWMVTTSRQLEINAITVHPRTPDTIFIATNNYGVMVSRDAGKTFVPTNSGFSGRFVNTIVADRETSNRVYATTINTTTGGGFFFVSNDGGASWQPLMRNMPPRLIGYSILQDERDGNIIYLGTNLGLYRSIDRGTSWTAVTARKTAAPPKKRAPQRAAAARKPTAKKRGAATAQSTPPPSAPGERIVTPQKNSDATVRRAQEALDRAGYEIGNPDGQLGPRTVAAIKRFQSDRYLPVSGKLDEATLGALGVGEVARTVAPHVAALTEPVNAMVSFVDGNGRLGILAATNAGLYKTLDPNQGWDRVSYGRGLDVRTNAISTSDRNPRLIFVGTAASGLLVSRDAGETWQQMSGIPTNSPVNVIVQDPKRSDYIYVGTKSAFYLSHDGGEKWSRRGGDLPFGDFNSILINPRNTEEIFTGNAYQNGASGGGVYRSTNSGSTWTRIDARELRLPSMGVWALALDPRDQNTLFVGSHSAGVYVVSRGAEASLNSVR